ncbi:PKD domain-containing protein [Methanosarcina acetivorans]|nr:PKD domain-containing protein [Methanosarcina acetivorans]
MNIRSKYAVYIFPLLLILFFVGTASALPTVAHDRVQGEMYVASTANWDSHYSTNSFDVPNGTVVFARYYVGVWASGTPSSISATFNGHAFETNPSYYISGMGVTWIPFNVTDYVQPGETNTATIDSSHWGDGRQYGSTLVVVLENENKPEVEYWIAEGLDWVIGYGSSTTYFNDTNIDLDDVDSASLYSTILTGYSSESLNGESLSGAVDSVSGAYFNYIRWDNVKDSLTAENQTIKVVGDGDYTSAVLHGLSITYKIPDLVPTSLTPSYVTPGTVNTMTATIENTDKDSPSFNVSLIADGTVVDTQDVSGIAAGGSTTVDLQWTPEGGKDSYSLTVVVDPDNSVVESEETNNELTVLVGSASVEVPVANFTAVPTSGSIPLTVNFTDQSTNSPTSWFWDFGDGENSTSQNPSHTYTSVGNHTVSLTVTNAEGSDSEVKTDYITVEVITPVAAFTADNTSGAAPFTVQFTDQSANLPAEWFWDFGDGTNSTEQNPAHTYITAGKYTVKLTTANAAGNDSEEKTDYITAYIPPVANFTATPTSGGAPLTVTFTDTSTNMPTEWLWDFGDGVNSTDQNPIHTYTSAGNYTVSFTATNSGGSDSELKTAYITVTAEAGKGGLADTAWPKFHYDLGNTGQSPYTGPQTANVVWTYTTTGEMRLGQGAVIGSDGTMYIGDRSGTLYAINPNGTLKWGTSIGTKSFPTPAIASDGTIYAGGNDKIVYAINPDGSIKWSYPVGTKSVISSPAIASDGTIYFATSTNLFALKPDGTLKWNSAVSYGGYNYFSPAIGSDGTIYLGTYGGALSAINADGTLKWTYSIPAPNNYIYDTPAIASDGTIYFGCNNANLYALNPDGTLKWTYSVGTSASQAIKSSPAIGSDGTIYFGSNNQYFYALYPDGTLKWSSKAGSFGQTTPTIGSDGTIYIDNYGSKTLYAFNPDGTVKWSYADGNYNYASPAIASDGTLYFGKGYTVYAFRDVAPVSNFTADPTSGTAPLTVNFTDQSTGSPTSWFWDFGDGANSTEQNPVHTYSVAGNYTTNLTVTNSAGTDFEVKTDYITVLEPSTPEPEPVAAFTADVTSGSAPLTVNFTDQSTGSPTSWLWDFGDGTNSTEQNPVHTYASAGSYTVNLTVENDAGSDFELKTDYIEVSEISGSTVTLYFDPESSSVAENESTEISLVASNFPAGLSGYNLTVAIDDPAVAEIVGIEYPTWALITENSTLPGTSIYMKTVDLEDSIKEEEGEVVLATLTVSGKEKGSANISIGVKRLEDDSGDSIEPALLTGTIEVTILSLLPDQEYAPKDLDGDGLYEDLTGNGEFSFVDIVAYFHNMDWIEENMPVEYFDFNGNGRIDFDDVVDMFAMI